MVNLLTTLTGNLFDENNWREIWQNNRFQYLIRESIDDLRIVDKLFSMGCQTCVPLYIPCDITKKINKWREDQREIEMPEIIENTDELIELLKRITDKCFPENFQLVLTNSLHQNKNLLRDLEKRNFWSFFKWNYDRNVFTEAIDISTIIKIVKFIVEQEKAKNQHKAPINVGDFSIEFQPGNSSPNITELQLSKFPLIQNTELFGDYSKVFGDLNKRISNKSFIQLNDIIEKPNYSPENLNQCFSLALPYVMQNVKMWGCNVLTADNISGLITNEQVREKDNDDKKTNRNPPFGKKCKPPTETQEQKLNDTTKIPFSRLDMLVGLINTVDSIVAQDILNLLAKFSMSIPLIIPKFRQNFYEVSSIRQ